MIVYLSYRVGIPHHTGRPSWEITKRLASLGHNILMFEGVPPYASYNMLHNILSFRGKQISISDISRISAQIRRNLKERILLEMSKHCSRMRTTPDLVFVDNFSELSLAMEISEHYNVPIFFRWYGIWDFPERLQISNYLLFKLKPWIAPVSLIKLNIIKKLLVLEQPKKIVITEDGAATFKFRGQLLKYLGTSSDIDKAIVFIRNSLPHKKVLKFCRPQQHINIIYVSRLTKSKRSSTVIWALFWLKKERPDLFQKVCLHVVGYGAEMSKMKKLAEKLKVNSHITFYGYIKNVELTNHLKDVCFSLALVVNSHNPIIEALFSGIPVVANDFGEVERIFSSLMDTGVLYMVNTRSLKFSEKAVGRIYASKVIDALNYLENVKCDLSSIKKLNDIFPTVEDKVQQEVNLILELIN